MQHSAEPLFPPLKWAQRSDFVLLTVDVQDSAEVKVELKEEGHVFAFTCTAPSEQRRYACEVTFYKPISPEESHHAVLPRGIEFKLKKLSATRKDAEAVQDDDAVWPRLTATKAKHKCIQVDWSKWRDDDDDDEDAAMGDDLGDFGMGGESGIDYSKMMSQFMVDQGREGAEEMGGGMGEGGDRIPEFGAAKGQPPIVDEDDDDLPPLEEA